MGSKKTDRRDFLKGATAGAALAAQAPLLAAQQTAVPEAAKVIDRTEGDGQRAPRRGLHVGSHQVSRHRVCGGQPRV